MQYVTYSDLIAFAMFIVAIITLVFYDINVYA